jgi:hypothetical protein
MNFMGQIDLQNTLAFGAAASIITWFVYPRLERLLARVRPAIMNIVFVVVVGVGAILFSLYLVSPPATETEVAQKGADGELELVSSAAEAIAEKALDLGAATGSADKLTDEQKADISRHTFAAAAELRKVSAIVDEAGPSAEETSETNEHEEGGQTTQDSAGL